MAMNCREFESEWNELLDAETSGKARVPLVARVRPVPERARPRTDAAVDERERALLDHAASCPACRPWRRAIRP